MPLQECAAPEELVAAVERLDPAALAPFEKGDASGIAAAIDALTGRRAAAAGRAR